MTCALMLSSFDLPSRSSSGFILRFVAARTEPFQLYGPLARRFPFSLIAPHSDIIIGTGHGTVDSYMGQQESVIWQADSINRKEVDGKVIKLVACDCGALLGPALIANGAKCFWGYDEDLLWIADENYYYQPWGDPSAKSVMMPIVDGINCLLDGSPAEQAFAVEKNGFIKNMGNTDFGLERDCLQFNASHMVLLGDTRATVRPRLKITMPIPPPPLII